jgi:RNA polymerase sigma factor (sigma-70 family)
VSQTIQTLLRHLLGADPAGDLTDADLLERFAARRDEAAFAELVARHGPKVFAVCRRVLGHHHLAEDAFQATFLVLARRARSVRPRSAVGGFLYGVARRAALEALAMSRRRKETLVGTAPDQPATEPPGVEPDVLAMLDEEIANLSDPLRAAVVLCELDGVSRAEAARQLGIAEGTLSSRLASARKQLAERLKKRGVALSAGLLTALADSARSAVRGARRQEPARSSAAGRLRQLPRPRTWPFHAIPSCTYSRPRSSPVWCSCRPGAGAGTA